MTYLPLLFMLAASTNMAQAKPQDKPETEKCNGSKCFGGSTCFLVGQVDQCVCKIGFVYKDNQCKPDTQEQATQEQVIQEPVYCQPECGGGSRCTGVGGENKCVCKLGFVFEDNQCKPATQEQATQEQATQEQATQEPVYCQPECGGESRCFTVGGEYKCVCEIGFVFEDNQCKQETQEQAPQEQATQEPVYCQPECGGEARCFDVGGENKCVCKIGFVFEDNQCKQETQEQAPQEQATQEQATQEPVYCQPECGGEARCFDVGGENKCVCKIGFNFVAPDQCNPV